MLIYFFQPQSTTLPYYLTKRLPCDKASVTQKINGLSENKAGAQGPPACQLNNERSVQTQERVVTSVCGPALRKCSSCWSHLFVHRRAMCWPQQFSRYLGYQGSNCQLELGFKGRKLRGRFYCRAFKNLILIFLYFFPPQELKKCTLFLIFLHITEGTIRFLPSECGRSSPCDFPALASASHFPSSAAPPGLVPPSQQVADC